MAYTTADLDALDRAIAMGTLRVKSGDRDVTYRSMEELRQAREHVAAQLDTANGVKRFRVVRVQPGSGL